MSLWNILKNDSLLIDSKESRWGHQWVLCDKADSKDWWIRSIVNVLELQESYDHSAQGVYLCEDFLEGEFGDLRLSSTLDCYFIDSIWNEKWQNQSGSYFHCPENLRKF